MKVFTAFIICAILGFALLVLTALIMLKVI